MNTFTVAAIVLTLMIVMIVLGLPIFASLGLSGAVGLILLRGTAALTMIPMNIYGHLNNFTLLAVPLFIFMAETIVASGLAKDLFTAAQKWLNKASAGLAVASIGSCAIFGALSGSISAALGGIGTMAIPEMLDRGYSPKMASGSVASAAGLSFIIPPSSGFIIYGWLMEVSVGDLFISGIVPGILLTIALVATTVIWAKARPQDVPAKEETNWKDRWHYLGRIWPVIVLVAAVMGVIYSGVATPTEAAAVASVIALIIAAVFYRKLDWATLKQICIRTTRTTCTLGILVASASLFGNFLALMGFPQAIARAIAGLDMSATGVVVIIMIFFFIAGVFFDGMAVMMIVLPLLKPALTMLGVDFIWFGVLAVIMMQIGVISPPFAVNLFMVKGFCPQLDLKDIFTGVLPYIVAQLVVVVILFAFPSLCTCLL